MKQEALFKKLGNILSELNEQYSYLSQNPEQLSELELELFLANANFLAEHIQIIKKLNYTALSNAADTAEDNPPQPAIKVEKEITPSSVEVHHPEVVEEPEEEPEEEKAEIFTLEEESVKTFEFILDVPSYNEDEKFDFEEKSADKLYDRPLSKEEELILEQKRKVKENLVRNTDDLEEDEVGPEPFLVSKEQQNIEEPEEKEIVAVDVEMPLTPEVTVNRVVVETTKTSIETAAYQPTLNDVLAGKNGGSRLNETSNAVVSDLKTAININDKMLYIKDLFNGYNLAYAEAIEIANKLPNFDAADNFFQKNYAVKNNWADKQATVDKFYKLLNQRFRD